MPLDLSSATLGASSRKKRGNAGTSAVTDTMAVTRAATNSSAAATTIRGDAVSGDAGASAVTDTMHDDASSSSAAATHAATSSTADASTTHGKPRRGRPKKAHDSLPLVSLPLVSLPLLAAASSVSDDHILEYVKRVRLQGGIGKQRTRRGGQGRSAAAFEVSEGDSMVLAAEELLAVGSDVSLAAASDVSLSCLSVSADNSTCKRAQARRRPASTAPKILAGAGEVLKKGKGVVGLKKGQHKSGGKTVVGVGKGTAGKAADSACADAVKAIRVGRGGKGKAAASCLKEKSLKGQIGVVAKSSKAPKKEPKKTPKTPKVGADSVGPLGEKPLRSRRTKAWKIMCA